CPFPLGSLRTAPSRRPWPRPYDGSYGEFLRVLWLRERVGLAPGALHRSVHLGLVAIDDGPEVERAVQQLVGRFLERVAHLHLPHVVLHVLRVPAARVGAEWERRARGGEVGPG